MGFGADVALLLPSLAQCRYRVLAALPCSCAGGSSSSAYIRKEFQPMKPTSNNFKQLGIGLLGVTMVLAGGCSNYVKRADLDAALADLRARDNAIESKVDANTSALNSLRQELTER